MTVPATKETEALAPSPPDDARCLDCGYALRGLTTPRCPECGREFDPDDSETMNVGGPGRIARIWLRPAGWILYAWGAVTAILYVLTRGFVSPYSWIGTIPRWSEHHVLSFWGARLYPIPNFFWAGLLLVWIVRIIGRNYVVRKYRLPHEQLRADRRARRITCALFILMLIPFFLPRTDMCSHARYYEVANIGGVAISDSGGPCGNHAAWRYQVHGNVYIYLDVHADEWLTDFFNRIRP